MPFDAEDNLFLLAGPVKMHPRVLRAMSRPAVAHRDAGFKAVNEELRTLLQMAFQTRHDVALLSGSGTLAMDAAAFSLLQKGDKVLALENGKFGNRFAKMAVAYGDATTLKAPWGQPIPLDTIKAKLAEVRPKAVFLTHNESSVGFTWPLHDIAKAAHDAGALVVADCITSVGGLDVRMDEWGVDVAIVGSQKCLGAPSGLSAVGASPRAVELMRDAGFYLNLRKWIEKFRDGDTPFTPAIPLHLAMVESLRLLKEEGLPNRFARLAKQAQGTRAAFEAMGLELFVPDGYRSGTVTAVKYPVGVDDAKFRKSLKEKHGVVIAGGQDDVKGKIFRVGHMGTVSTTEIAGGLFAIERALVEAGAPVKRGVWAEAFSAATA